MIEATWVYKLRTVKGKKNVERVVKIPPEVVDQFGGYVRIRLSEGKLILEPVESTKEGQK